MRRGRAGDASADEMEAGEIESLPNTPRRGRAGDASADGTEAGEIESLPNTPTDSDRSRDEATPRKMKKVASKFKLAGQDLVHTTNAIKGIEELRNLRKHPLGTCSLNWVSANATLRQHQGKHFDLHKYIATDSAARFMLNWSILGPSVSAALCAAQIAAVMLFAIGLPLVAAISGGNTFFCATFVANSCNILAKLVGVRFQALKGGGNIKDAAARVWCIAPTDVSEPHRAALERVLSFRSLVPVGGPLGCVQLVVPFVPLFLNRDQGTVQAWERAAFWTTAGLAFLPVVQVQTPVTQLFIRSCSVLHDTIQTLGIYEATIDQEKRRKRSLTVVAANDLSTVLSSVDRRASYYRDKSRDEDAAASLASPSNRSIVSTLTEEDAEAWADGEHGLAEAAAFRFKQAYENFGIMSKHVNDFSEAWSFYFFFAEFILVIVVGFSGLGAFYETKATINAWKNKAQVWPQCILAGYMYFAFALNGRYLFKVFCGAASITSACEQLLDRCHELHGSLASHSPELQPECLRFHDHVRRARLGFQAMRIHISYKLGGVVIYMVATTTVVAASSVINPMLSSVIPDVQ